MLDALLWWTFGRYRLQWRFPGFMASHASRVDFRSTFGKNVRLHGNSRVTRSDIGSYSYVSAGARVGFARVGKFCCIGPEAIVGGLGRHPTRWLSVHPLFYSTRRQVGLRFVEQDHFDELPAVELGNDVWIGARAIILDGIRIGDGAIIGAGAVVTRDIAPYQVCAGVPARSVRSRFSEADIAALESLRWWDWSEPQLRSAAALMRTGDVDALVAYARAQELPAAHDVP